MKSKKISLEHTLSPEQTAAFLRAVADAIETGKNEKLSEYGFDLHDLKKMEVGLKKHGIQMDMRLKIKYEESEKSPGDTPKRKKKESPEETRSYSPSYKSLKKKMKKTFSALGASLKEDDIPDQKDVESFLKDSEKMVDFPGYAVSRKCQF